MRRFKGIIFDFNGTLFWDSDKHEFAWNTMSMKLRNCKFGDGELHESIYGKTNKSIFEYLLGTAITNERLQDLIQEKEQMYRDLCAADADGLKLAPGAVSLLDYLKERGIPRTIATASEITNLNFFMEKFNLFKWFDNEKIAYDDGTISGKPEPDLYLKASELIEVKPEDCIVVEDAVSGITAAVRAGIGKIIAIGTKPMHEGLKKTKGVSSVITDFTELDKNIFEY